MSMLSAQIKELREMAVSLGVNGVCTGDLSKLYVMLREAADTIESMRDRLQADSEQTCHATQANYEHCKYSTDRGWRDTSMYAELFGTPERAARTLSIMQRCELGIIENCDDCDLHDACRVRDGDYDALLEWLEGETE